jgi:glycosyltransferase involved in cell wall biosynthesis
VSETVDGIDVLHVITDSTWGGAQRIVQLLATRTGGNATVACNTGGRLVDELRDAGVAVVEFPSLQSAPDPVADVRVLARLTGHLRRSAYDLVHCHSTKAGALGRVAAAIAGLPTVFTVHGWGFYNTEYGKLAPLVRWGERGLARVTDEIVCVSAHDRRIGRRHGIVPPGTGRVVHNGIDPFDVPADRVTLPALCGFDAERPVVGSIGRLSHQKRPEAVIEVGERLVDRGHDPAVVLIGDGPRMDACRRRARTADVDVHLLGFREDALALLTDFTAFTLPSRFEGLPLTVLECLHAGVPVVASDVGGVAEAIDEGETGHVVPPDRLDLFADRVEALLADRTRRATMAENCRTAATRFDAERMVQAYDDIYSDVVARS